MTERSENDGIGALERRLRTRGVATGLERV